jgi:uncharacterized protein
LVIGNFTLNDQKYYTYTIKELLRYVDMPHRLLYGSDWPISNMESYIKFVNKLKLNKQRRDILLFKNSSNVFRL